jgi:hypothetical protein
LLTVLTVTAAGVPFAPSTPYPEAVMTSAPPNPSLSPAASAILDLVHRFPTMTFPELQGRLQAAGIPVSGDESLWTDKNIVLWTGMSKEMVAAIKELRQSKAIHLLPCPALNYVDDGAALDLPIAQRPPRNGYAKPHWAPVVFRPGPAPSER